MIIVSGIPGAGKTTVLSKVFEDPVIVQRYQKVVFGDVASEVAGGNRDKIRSMSLDEQYLLQKEVFSKILEMDKQKEVLLDTHCFVPTAEGYLPGLPSEYLPVKPRKIILITGKLDILKERIRKDATRDRSDVLARLEEIIATEKMYAIAYSALYSSPLTIVDNSGELEIAVEKVKSLLLNDGENG